MDKKVEKLKKDGFQYFTNVDNQNEKKVIATQLRNKGYLVRQIKRQDNTIDLYIKKRVWYKDSIVVKIDKSIYNRLSKYCRDNNSKKYETIEKILNNFLKSKKY